MRNTEHRIQKPKTEMYRFHPSLNEGPHFAIRNPQAAFPYQAVIFDLLSALLNSWKLWNEIAGSDEIGLRSRKRYIQLTYAAGRYRPYEGIIGEAATAEGIPGGSGGAANSIVDQARAVA